MGYADDADLGTSDGPGLEVDWLAELIAANAPDAGDEPDTAFSVEPLNHTGEAIFGTRSDDELRGGSGFDSIFGRKGDDLLRGRRGDDLLDGGSGGDLIFGGRGRDDIFGGGGLDTLFGGRGADDFFFDTTSRYDVIEDFSSRDFLLIDTQQGDFEGVRRRDITIVERRAFDELYVDGDLVAEVYGDFITDESIVLF